METPLPATGGDLGAAPPTWQGGSGSTWWSWWPSARGGLQHTRVLANSAHAQSAPGAFRPPGGWASPGAPLSTIWWEGWRRGSWRGWPMEGDSEAAAAPWRLAAARPPSFRTGEPGRGRAWSGAGGHGAGRPGSGAVNRAGAGVLGPHRGAPGIRASLFAMRLAWGVWSRPPLPAAVEGSPSTFPAGSSGRCRERSCALVPAPGSPARGVAGSGVGAGSGSDGWSSPAPVPSSSHRALVRVIRTPSGARGEGGGGNVRCSNEG